MTLFFIRAFFFVVSILVGYYVGLIYDEPFLGLGIAAAVSILLFLVERNARSVSVRGLSSMVFGLLLGLFMAKLLSDVLILLPLSISVQSVARLTLTIIFSYLGAVMALRGKDEFNLIIPYVRFKRQDVDDRPVLLDTSAIIDGRILDVALTNFFERRLVVPRFVLDELQALVDSSDEMKKKRGRRGLDIISRMKENSDLMLHIHEEDVPLGSGVDSKLVRMAKVLGADICTTDYNLGSVADVQGIKVLNIHVLASAVRSMFTAGDILHIHLIKGGKEQGQAIGYSDDGSMVVVAAASDRIGQDVNVEIKSVLQTQSGRMAFADLKG